MDNETLRYPIGKFSAPSEVTPAQREEYIAEIKKLPQDLRRSVASLNEEQLDTPYREGGWTLRQVVHHVPDSHINSYVRYKWTLTEDNPTIKAYYEDRWAELPDTQYAPIALSLDLLEAIHQRWVILLRHMQEADWAKSFVHPDGQRAIRLDTALATYVWHGKHHLAHIESLKQSKGW